MALLCTPLSAPTHVMFSLLRAEIRLIGCIWVVVCRVGDEGVEARAETAPGARVVRQPRLGQS